MVENIPNTFQNFQIQNRQSRTVQQPQKTQHKKMSDYFIPAGLITSGAILLYYGIKSPTKTQLINKLVKERTEQIQSNLRVYTKAVDETISSSYEQIANYIRKFIDDNTFEPITLIRHIKEPKTLLKEQDIAYSAVNLAGTEGQKAGASAIGNFSVVIGNVFKNVSDNLEHQKELMRLLFNDYCKLPKLKDSKYEQLLLKSEGDLRDTAGLTLSQMTVHKFLNHKAVFEKYYSEMAQAITNTRQNRMAVKKQIVEDAYAALRQILGLGEEFAPSYSRLPNLDRFNKLTKAELKPQQLPAELVELYKENVYFESLMSKDFSKLTNDDLTQIFYRADYDNNLQDLRLLIDRIRLHQAYAQKKSPKLVPAYENSIAKLEYLANQLDDFAKSELLKMSSKEFRKVPEAKRQANLYYVSRISRRMGFNTISELDEFMSKDLRFKNLEIREFVEDFIQKPEVYFF